MSTSHQKKHKIIAGLDLGTTKVSILIGSVKDDGVNIIGVGEAPSTGIRQGDVVNIEATMESIRKARLEAELMAGVEIQDVWLGVSGNHIESFDSKGMIAIKNQEVTSEDVDRVLETAKTVNVPQEREVLHVLPREYIIDDQTGVADPVGMTGVRLEASVHIITGSQTALQNSIKCCEKADLKVNGLVLKSLASSLSVLSPDERNLGVAVVDMGGGSCEILCFDQGAACFTTMVPVGGNHFTHDVAVGLRTPQSSAESIKRKYGCAISEMVDENESIDVEGVGGRRSRSVQRKYLCEVIEPRAEETLFLIKKAMMKDQLLTRLGSGVVLTGGASQLNGLIELGEFVFDVPVRMGLPTKTSGLRDAVRSPSFSTAFGLILYGLEQERARHTEKSSDKGLFAGVSKRIKNLLSGAL